MRILLVEDDKDLQRLLKKALTDAGYVVDQAFDGEEGHFLISLLSMIRISASL